MAASTSSAAFAVFIQGNHVTIKKSEKAAQTTTEGGMSYDVIGVSALLLSERKGATRAMPNQQGTAPVCVVRDC